MGKIGLVLEGGGMKGLYTAGVIDVFLENGIRADIALGSSAGVAFGCNYKSRQKGRVVRYVTKYRNDWRFGSFRSLIKTGNFFGAEFCYRDIPEKLDPWDSRTFAEDPCEFYAVITDVDSGQTYYHKMTDGGERDIQYVRASSTVPILSKIVELDGHRFLDGGLTCSIPLAKAIELGCSKNIVVCTNMKGKEKDGMGAVPLLKFFYRKYPNLTGNLNACTEGYRKEVQLVNDSEAAGSAFVFRPTRLITQNVAETSTKKLRALYELGRQDALERLDELKKWMEN